MGKWVEAFAVPPVSGSLNVGQVGVPVTVQQKAKRGEALVVSTSAIVGVVLTYQNAGSGVAAAPVWLPFGTWSLRLPADLLQVVLQPALVPFPGVPLVSVWVDESPPDAAC